MIIAIMVSIQRGQPNLKFTPWAFAVRIFITDNVFIITDSLVFIDIVYYCSFIRVT